MSGVLYVPTLPARPHAAAAYRDLMPDVRRRVAPLWTFPPRAESEAGRPEHHLRRAAGQVARVQKHHPAWFDAPYADHTVDAVAKSLRDYWSLTPLRPVTGPGRPPDQQAAAVETARADGRGLGIRVRLPGAWHDGLTASVLELAEATGPACPRDLFLDLGTVAADRPDADKEALRALDALVPLADWRHVAVVAGAFPEHFGDALEGADRAEADRLDGELWHGLHRSGRGYASCVRYGDYGTLPVRGTTVAHRGGGAPSWGALRYTTGRTFLVARFPTGGETRAESIRAAARWITGTDAYRGPGYSWGDRWLDDCARGGGSTGTGNAVTWNRAGNTQHMTYVVRSLRNAVGG